MGRCRCDYWYCGREWLDVIGGLSRCGGRKCGGSWGEDGGWWWWMGMLCCAVLRCCCLHAESQPKAHTKDGRDRASTAGRRKLVPEGLRSSGSHTKFTLPLLSSPSSSFFYNQDHQLKSSSLPPDSRVDTLALATPMDRSRANCHF